MDRDTDLRVEAARRLLGSVRGQYIISQALFYGIKAITTDDIHTSEPSNAADMQFLRENLFPMFMDPEQLRELANEYEAGEETKG